MTRVQPFGESAVLVDVEDADAAQRLRLALVDRSIAGLTAVVPGLRSVLVEFDPEALRPEGLRRQVLELVAEGLRTEVTPRTRRVPVVYGGDHGPDLEDVAVQVGLDPRAFASTHAALDHRVLLCGFAPGFAYIGDLPAEWVVPRLATPRARTPAGSVAVADGMTGIYPAELPGGWRVIGRTPLQLFDPRRDPPSYLLPGDRVVFEPIPATAWDAHAGGPPEP